MSQSYEPSDGQLEVRRIIKSFLERYEDLKRKGTNEDEMYELLYEPVIKVFSSNETIKNDAVTAQPLGTSQYSRDYLRWLLRTGEVEEIKSDFDKNPTIINASMSEVVYDLTNGEPLETDRLKPAYKGGARPGSIISCLFGLAQGKLLDSMHEGLWISNYYEALDLWEADSGGQHRLVAHILYGSNKINPWKLNIFRNKSVDPLLNQSLIQFEELFRSVDLAVHSEGKNITHHRTSLTFKPYSLNEEQLKKIKNFFQTVSEEEEHAIARCIKALIESNNRKYVSVPISKDWKEISIEDMYCLLKDIRTAKSRPSWHRRLFVWKQQLLGIGSVDTITRSILQLATPDGPHFNSSELNDKGQLHWMSDIARKNISNIFNWILGLQGHR